LSAHGDQKDLLNWFSGIRKQTSESFFIHGENQPADELYKKLASIMVLSAAGFVPLMGKSFNHKFLTVVLLYNFINSPTLIDEF
jgi:metallo-beta-lactamase family protein